MSPLRKGELPHFKPPATIIQKNCFEFWNDFKSGNKKFTKASISEKDRESDRFKTPPKLKQISGKTKRSYPSNIKECSIQMYSCCPTANYTKLITAQNLKRIK